MNDKAKSSKMEELITVPVSTRRKTMKTKKVTVPLVTRCDGDGNITHDYIGIPVTVYEQWLKQCYELSGN